ncbi:MULTISPECIES: TIGR02444 family protein [unclassified Sinorhizobium]|uniref:TIGR02444 family protein n=1 Tax=unclassified Sinorhizobium TaxID=2613772 RepID=UPI003523CDAC
MDDTNLWDFAVRLYGMPGVADTCLALQEECGVDVPVLLFSAWLADRSVALSAPEMRRIATVVADWHREVVVPLRTVRRRLKFGPRPAPDQKTESLRNTIKGAELSAERIELTLLEAEGLSLSSTGKSDPVENMMTVVRYYRGCEPDERAVAAIGLIARLLA